MNWKAKVIIPMLKALNLTLIVFALLLALCAAVAAHSIWIQGHHDSKFGNEWGNFQFYLMIYSMILGVQCGIVLVGNLISAIIAGRGFTLSLTVASACFAVANGILIVLKSDPTRMLFLFGIPTTCAILAIIGTAIETRRHPTRQMEDIVA